jgi:hypothetical protein
MFAASTPRLPFFLLCSGIDASHVCFLLKNTSDFVRQTRAYIGSHTFRMPLPQLGEWQLQASDEELEMVLSLGGWLL